MATQAQEAAQREGLGAFGDALLGEGGEARAPELVEGGEDAGGVFFSPKFPLFLTPFSS